MHRPDGKQAGALRQGGHVLLGSLLVLAGWDGDLHVVAGLPVLLLLGWVGTSVGRYDDERGADKGEVDGALAAHLASKAALIDGAMADGGRDQGGPRRGEEAMDTALWLAAGLEIKLLPEVFHAGATAGLVVELLGTLLQGDRLGLDLDGVDGGGIANVVAAKAGIAAAHVCREEDRAVLAVVGDLGAEGLDHLVPHDRMHDVVLGQRLATLRDDVPQVFLHLLEDGIGEVDASGDRGEIGLGSTEDGLNGDEHPPGQRRGQGLRGPAPTQHSDVHRVDVLRALEPALVT